MVIELRKKSQITIPKEIINELELKEGDHLDLTVKDGMIIIEPVALYSKPYIEKLENIVKRINEDLTTNSSGPFKTVEDAIAYLEETE